MEQTNAKSEITLDIESLSYGPYGVGRFQGQVILIPATVPGDRVVARIIEKKANYALGKLVRIIQPSPQRQKPPCPYVPECGGCPWQPARYHTQLAAKQKSVEDALRRIGKLSGFELRPILPSPSEYAYRRRIQLHVDDGKRLGLFKAESHQVVEIGSCLIAGQNADLHIETLRPWVRNMRTPLEGVEIVTGDQPGEVVIVATSTAKLSPDDESAITTWLQDNSTIGGLIFTGPGSRRTWGQTKISLMTEPGIRLTVEADIFTQVNPEGSRRLVNQLLSASEFDAEDRVLELYCGAGNFTLSIARHAGQAVAVEADRRAVDSGKLSAQLNGLNNIHWIVSQVPAALKRLSERGEKFSKIVLDPPRAGAKAIDRELATFEAEKILYISCNPATLARDLAALASHNYKLTAVQPIDFFPHTFHVEALAVMERQ